jgi:hypothetical protein
MIDLTPLLPLIDLRASDLVKDCEAAAELGEVIAGRLGKTAFVVTTAPDGSCHASLSRADRRPTAGEAAAFFRRWGVTPEDPTPRVFANGRGIMFTVRHERTVH